MASIHTPTAGISAATVEALTEQRIGQVEFSADDAFATLVMAGHEVAAELANANYVSGSGQTPTDPARAKLRDAA